jgi:hypothetical protein
MAKFDFKHAKQDIAEINAIVATCPDAVKEKCFELLFGIVFHERQSSPHIQDEAAKTLTEAPKEKAPEGAAAERVPQGRKLPANVLAFARRHNIATEELEKLFLLDHDPLLPVYKIPHGNVTKAQLYKVMMVLLENGLLNNQLSAPYSELRENVKEDGLFDGNFNKMLKRNHPLFKGAVTKDSIKEADAIELTGTGLARLAEIVKELAQS